MAVELEAPMWQFDWGVFWAVLVAGTILSIVFGIMRALTVDVQIIDRLDTIASRIDAEKSSEDEPD